MRTYSKVKPPKQSECRGLLLSQLNRGDRLVRVNELQILAKLHGLTVNGLLLREAVHVNSISRFCRLKKSQSNGVVEAVKLLNNLVRAETEWENILGIKR